MAKKIHLIKLPARAPVSAHERFLLLTAMQQLSAEDFEACAPEFNRAVAAFPGIDPYCSRTDWVLPFHGAFTPESPLLVWQDEGSFLALARSAAPDAGELYSSIESMWGFAAALVGPRSPALLGRACAGPLRRGHIVLLGLPPDRDFLSAVTGGVAPSHRAFMLNPVGRCVASLAGGMAGFLSRRQRKFRVNARRAAQRAARAGLAFTHVEAMPRDRIDAFYDQILAIEAASWKGLQGQGVDRGPMREFYRGMLRRIIPAGMLRAIIALLDGRPVGYIHGALTGGRFRGLQLSFDECFRELSIGNLLQLNMIEWLSREGAQHYDLGMCVPYKRHWAELEQVTLTLYLRPL
jgi:hypothetical protein